MQIPLRPGDRQLHAQLSLVDLQVQHLLWRLQDALGQTETYSQVFQVAGGGHHHHVGDAVIHQGYG